MKPHVSHGDLVALWIGFLLGLAALLGGLQNLVGVLRGQTQKNKDGIPKFDSGTALIGIAVGSLFIWITMIYGLPQKRAQAREAQREELRQWLNSNAATMPVDTFLAYVRVGAVGIDEEFGGQSALLQYVYAGDGSAVTRLLDAGANVNAHHAEDSTPLLTAVDDDDISLVRVLLAAHANPNPGAGNVPIFDAVDPETAGQPANADLGDTEDAPRKNDGHNYTADRQQIVTALAAAGADLNVRDERSYTPLMIAVASGQCDLVAALVLAHADEGLRAKTGETALDWAGAEDHPECAPLLAGGQRARASAEAMVAASAARHPARLSEDKHLEGTQSEFQKRLAAQVAEAARVARTGHRLGWFGDLLGGWFQTLLWSLIVSTLSYFSHRVWRFLRGDHRPVRWAWIPVSVSSSSSSAGGSASDDGEDDGPSRGGGSGGGGASRNF